MAISITPLSGGNTPADGSDPRTFPAIWNATATALEGVAADLDTLEAEVGDYDLPSLNGVSIIGPTTGEVLKYNGTSWANAADEAGKILQVVSVSVTNTFTTTSSSFVERTGLSVSITPSSTSSKIFAQLVHGGVESTSGSSATQTKIYAGGVDIGAPISSVFFVNGGDRAPVSVDYLDSPNTTSAITYAAYVSVSIGTGSFRRGTLTLMEVAG